MRVSTVIFAVLAGALFAAAAPQSEYVEQPVLRLSHAHERRIHESTISGDDPAALAAIIGNHQVWVGDIDPFVCGMARLNRDRCIEYLLPHLNFREPDGAGHYLASLLNNALLAHRLEQCEMLLRKDVDFNSLPKIGEFFCYTDRTIHWTLDELVHLVDDHPELARALEPGRWNLINTLDKCFMMLDFLRHLKEIDEEIANKPKHQLEAVAHEIMHNLYFDDYQQIAVMQRLVNMGLNLQGSLIEDLEQDPRKRVRVIQFLRSVVPLETKEPASD